MAPSNGTTPLGTNAWSVLTEGQILEDLASLGTTASTQTQHSRGSSSPSKGTSLSAPAAAPRTDASHNNLVPIFFASGGSERFTIGGSDLSTAARREAVRVARQQVASTKQEAQQLLFQEEARFLYLAQTLLESIFAAGGDEVEEGEGRVDHDQDPSLLQNGDHAGARSATSSTAAAATTAAVLRQVRREYQERSNTTTRFKTSEDVDQELQQPQAADTPVPVFVSEQQKVAGTSHEDTTGADDFSGQNDPDSLEQVLQWFQRRCSDKVFTYHLQKTTTSSSSSGTPERPQEEQAANEIGNSSSSSSSAEQEINSSSEFANGKNGGNYTEEQRVAVTGTSTGTTSSDKTAAEQFMAAANRKTDKQNQKDLQRDTLRVNGRTFASTPYPETLEFTARALLQKPSSGSSGSPSEFLPPTTTKITTTATATTTNLDDAVATLEDRFGRNTLHRARTLLSRVNRTVSGGLAFEKVLLSFGQIPGVFVVPESKNAAPLELLCGPDVALGRAHTQYRILSEERPDCVVGVVDAFFVFTEVVTDAGMGSEGGRTVVTTSKETLYLQCTPGS
ncbi:unnamed protein product [Amoebophrya sp. A120]|nr:unnamed protein product [Amoebophrya sp. A120]|eukprot:GSA120T00020069001.1